MTRWSPRRWAAAFEAAGGFLWMEMRRDGGTGLGLGWRVYGFTQEQNLQARRLFGEIERHDARWAAVALLIRWCGSVGRSRT